MRLEADADASHQSVVTVLSVLSKLNVEQVAIVSLPESIQMTTSSVYASAGLHPLGSFFPEFIRLLTLFGSKCERCSASRLPGDSLQGASRSSTH